MIKKTAKTVRKTFKKAAGPVGITTGALTLGGLTALAAFSPDVRQRSRELASSAVQGLRRLVGREDDSTRRSPLLEHAH